MLQTRWYLTNTDWFAQLPDAPPLGVDEQRVIGQLAHLFGDESSFGPATTVAATHAVLLAAEHLADTMTHAAGTHELTELARLLCGLNLIQAHLTQAIQRIAEHVNGHAFPGLAYTPDAAVQALTDSLSTAAASGEISAGHLKDAHLILRTASH